MTSHPVAILKIAKTRSADARFVAQISATTRNFRGQETEWVLHVSPTHGVRSAFRYSGRALPREEHIDRVPGNLSDLAFTLAMEA